MSNKQYIKQLEIEKDILHKKEEELQEKINNAIKEFEEKEIARIKSEEQKLLMCIIILHIRKNEKYYDKYK